VQCKREASELMPSGCAIAIIPQVSRIDWYIHAYKKTDKRSNYSCRCRDH